ncbi:MAG: SEC-C domain-containing protein [Clostridiales bacterium]|nr:SEC-C domain-containing protein [Clostridiales bacterium]
MTLYEKWIAAAYDKTGKIIKKRWDEYIPLEQAVYSNLLTDKTTHIEGTVSELGASFHMTPEYVIGFLDGINEALEEPLELKDLTADSPLKLDFSFERLYKKMVEYRAEHLCELPEWDEIFDEETRRRMYKEQRGSTTIRKDAKINRNDPCPCGSGKKYKKCCGERLIAAE